MIPIPPERIEELLVRDSQQVIANASRQYSINGFAYVFEIGQPEPCFWVAINTSKNGLAAPSTGEWDFPAGGFEGGTMSAEWQECYKQLDHYVREDEESETKLVEVRAIFCKAMKETRRFWITKLANCMFTVNECNDSHQAVRDTYEDINDVQT